MGRQRVKGEAKSQEPIAMPIAIVFSHLQPLPAPMAQNKSRDFRRGTAFVRPFPAYFK